MNPLEESFRLLFGRMVTVFLEGAPAVTASVTEINHGSVRLTAISGSSIFIPFDRITAIQEFPSAFPPAP